MPDDVTWRAQPSPKTGLVLDYATAEELFSGARAFHMPWFQRAYAWGEDQAQRFLSDICRAMKEGQGRYFLGQILLGRDPSRGRLTIIDGQQRCFTLTILFALLRHRARDPETARRLHALIALPPEAHDERGSCRLAPQPTIAAFLHRTVQAEDAFTHPVDDFAASEVEANIVQNRNRMSDLLDEFEAAGNDIGELVDFLLARCLVVLRIIDGEEEAWEMLRTEEATGLPFHGAARAKVSLIAAMPKDEREAANALWEEWETKLTSDGMQDLIALVRDLSRRQRSSQPVEKDIATRFRLDRRGLAFMTENLVPAAERFLALRRSAFPPGPDHDALARCVRQMDWAGHRYWYAPAMRWLEHRGAAAPDTAAFFRLLVRKVWVLRICAVDAVEHERRFIALANEIADGRAVAHMRELDIPAADRRKVHRNLTGRTFYDKRYCRPLLRYLADILGSDPGEIDGFGVTIEHVLPRSPRRDSHWRRLFPAAEDVKDHAHRIGNLVFLTHADNQAIGNCDYDVKRDVLASSGFPFTAGAAAEPAWTREVITRRTTELTGAIFAHWGLKP